MAELVRGETVEPDVAVEDLHSEVPGAEHGGAGPGWRGQFVRVSSGQSRPRRRWFLGVPKAADDVHPTSLQIPVAHAERRPFTPAQPRERQDERHDVEGIPGVRKVAHLGVISPRQHDEHLTLCAASHCGNLGGVVGRAVAFQRPTRARPTTHLFAANSTPFARCVRLFLG